MPWKETDIMDQRVEFVLKSRDKNIVFKDLCSEFGILPKTGYKWVKRFLEFGLDGLHEHSRRPKNSPTELTEPVVCEIIKLKTAHPTWGAKKNPCFI